MHQCKSGKELLRRPLTVGTVSQDLNGRGNVGVILTQSKLCVIQTGYLCLCGSCSVEASAVAGVVLALLSAAPLSVFPHATMDNAMTDAVERAKNFSSS